VRDAACTLSTRGGGGGRHLVLFRVRARALHRQPALLDEHAPGQREALLARARLDLCAPVDCVWRDRREEVPHLRTKGGVNRRRHSNTSEKTLSQSTCTALDLHDSVSPWKNETRFGICQAAHHEVVNARLLARELAVLREAAPSQCGSARTCPISTEEWTRRVHFVREGGGGGGPARSGTWHPRDARLYFTEPLCSAALYGGRDAACPISTRGATRRVRLVRVKGQGAHGVIGGWSPQSTPPRALAGRGGVTRGHTAYRRVICRGNGREGGGATLAGPARASSRAYSPHCRCPACARRAARRDYCARHRRAGHLKMGATESRSSVNGSIFPYVEAALNVSEALHFFGCE